MHGKNVLIISKNTLTAIPYIKSVTEYLFSCGCSVFCLAEKANFFDGLNIVPLRSPELKTVDVALVFGGDGSILKAGRLLLSDKVPILGINMGTLGYLADVEPNEALNAVKNYLEGKFVIEKRCTLSVMHGKNYFPAINEAVIYRGTLSHIITININVDGQSIEALRADGIIVSTPTGSTAYNLSAGGPIVTPLADALVLTPICAHSLTARPIVLAGNNKISITVSDFRSEEKPSLDIDGKTVKQISENDCVKIKVAKEKLMLIHTKPTNFFNALQSKLSPSQNL